MPYRWQPADDTGIQRLRLWPHQSLPRAGFVLFIGVTAALISLPLLAVLGTMALWVLLPFLLAAVGAIWLALNRNYRDTAIVEDLILAPDLIRLSRRGPHRRRSDWQANPYWVQVTLHPSGGRVPHYLTLRGEGREVEIGAFLSEPERIALHDELTGRLARLKQPS